MLEFHLIKKLVEFLGAMGVYPEFSLVTNGTVGTDQDWAWLISQGFRITISADGPADIQDCQRPFSIGDEATSKRIENRFRFLQASSKTINIRSTILNNTATEINRVCDYFGQFSCVQTHHLEPASFAGRGSFLRVPELARHYSGFFSAYSKFLFSNPARFKSAWFKPFDFNKGFCGAVHFNAIVDPHGFISLCSEVDSTMADMEWARRFICRHISAETPFLSPEARAFALDQFLPKHCELCIIKFKCGGGCYVKRFRDFPYEDSFNAAFCRNAIKLNMSYLVGLYEQQLESRHSSSEHLGQ